MTAGSSFAFTSAEYEHRLGRLRQHMSVVGADIVIVDQAEHVCYLTGFLPTAAMYQCCVVPMDAAPIMIVRALDEPRFHEESWLRECVRFRDWEDPISILIDTIKANDWGRSRIGQELDSYFLSVARCELIRSRLPDAGFVDFSRFLWELRLRKSAEELAYHREAARIADAALAAAISVARAGMTERELMSTVYATALREGADNTRLAQLAGGRDRQGLHGGRGTRSLQLGDLLQIE